MDTHARHGGQLKLSESNRQPSPGREVYEVTQAGTVDLPVCAEKGVEVWVVGSRTCSPERCTRCRVSFSNHVGISSTERNADKSMHE